MEDSNIIELYFNRSENAISETSLKYGNYLGSISINILRSYEDAAECVNDTYLHAWNAIPPSRPSAFRVWLGTITRNLSFDRYKKFRAQKRGKNETELLLSELAKCIPAPCSVEKELEDNEIAQIVSGFLKAQRQENRIIFLRRYWYGDSIAQIAKIFDVSESKVKSSLFRTRNQLRRYLEKEGVIL
jgi:RNA polymerase sigma-70 factor (ECF subfamily)